MMLFLVHLEKKILHRFSIDSNTIAQCGSHQNHVFNNCPQPIGLRYCNYGPALRFVPEQKLPIRAIFFGS